LAENVSPEYQECLEKGRLRKYPPAVELAPAELEQAAMDLSAARQSQDQGSHKWASIQAYYAMFHAARALVYAAGLRERSHHCLQYALRELYVKTKRLDVRIVEALQLAKVLRENADYYGRFSPESAGQLINDAEEFLAAAQKLIAN
jgi:uncharacterized protein (UPF0332 family)